MTALLEEIRTARGYTCGLLAAVDGTAWFRIPSAGVSHIAWQVGHIAMAEYRLCLDRMRGVRPEDEDLISADLLERFGKGSVPEPDPAKNPSPDEVRAAFDRVHEQVLAELPGLPDNVLDEKVAPPHPMFSTKLGALSWAPRHELLHTGQIALLRRQLGAAPLR